MKNNVEYLLSIVVPTRNRQFYAIQTVKQILSIADKSTQVVVSDNSDDNSLKEMIEAINDDRVIYEYINDRIPGVDNYANGISMSDGKYVCCIGDDDGVLREIIDVVKWASDNNIKAIKPGVQASYIWPNTVELYKTGCLSLDTVDCSYKYINPKKELIPFLKAGCIDFPEAKLVKAYHGIVRRDLFEELKSRTGKFCGGLSPDIYLSVSLSLLVEELVCLNIPLTIFGACKQSTTGDSLNKINVGKLEDAPHFVGQKYEWSNKVPRFYCGMNIWADSALHALSDMKENDMMNLFSIEHLTSFCLLNYKNYEKEIMENFHLNNCDTKVLNDLLRSERAVSRKRNFKTFIKQQKIIFELYKKIRDTYYKLANSQSFSQNGVSDICEAERIVSKRIDGTFKQLVCTLINESGQ